MKQDLSKTRSSLAVDAQCSAWTLASSTGVCGWRKNSAEEKQREEDAYSDYGFGFPERNTSAKPQSVDSENALSTTMLSYVALLLTSELTSQPEKYNSGPTVMESTDLILFFAILKQLA
ncbi:hypothetical protein STEG23_001976 [Scotinomys teguina]